MFSTRAVLPRRDEGRGRAFTLIELIVVIVIVAILVGIAAVGYTSVIHHSHNTKTEVSLRQLHKDAMAIAASAQRPVELGDFQTAAADVPALSAFAPAHDALAAGTPEVVADGTKAAAPGVVLVSIDPANPNIVGLATKSTVNDCVTLSGVALNATTKAGGSDCTGTAALTAAQVQAALPTPAGTTAAPTPSPTTSTPTTPATTTTTPTTSTTTTSTTTTASPTTTTPAPEPTNAPSAMSFSARAGVLGAGGWQATAYGAGKYLAAGSTQIAVSSDAVTWTTQTLPTLSTTAVAAAYGNGRFVVMYANGYVRSSADGTTWTTIQGPLPYARSLYFANGQFVSAQTTQYGMAASTDGVTWTKTATLYTDNCVVGGGGLWVAPPAADNLTKTKTATDPLGTWTANTGLAIGYNYYRQQNCAYGNGRLVIGATNSPKVYASSNGNTWDATTTFMPNAIVFVNGEFAALSGTSVWTSTDGKAWAAKAAGATVSSYVSCANGAPRLACVTSNGDVFVGQ